MFPVRKKNKVFALVLNAQLGYYSYISPCTADLFLVFVHVRACNLVFIVLFQANIHRLWICHFSLSKQWCGLVPRLVQHPARDWQTSGRAERSTSALVYIYHSTCIFIVILTVLYVFIIRFNLFVISGGGMVMTWPTTCLHAPQMSFNTNTFLTGCPSARWLRKAVIAPLCACYCPQAPPIMLCCLVLAPVQVIPQELSVFPAPPCAPGSKSSSNATVTSLETFSSQDGVVVFLCVPHQQWWFVTTVACNCQGKSGLHCCYLYAELFTCPAGHSAL